MIKYVSIDVEADGPCPGLYSMVSLGAVVVEPGLARTFYGEFAPLPGAFWNEEALAVSKTSRYQHLSYPDPSITTERFCDWLKEESSRGATLRMVGDNPAFDWQFINYYLIRFCGYNPLGWSARRIGDYFAGLQRNFNHQNRWKQYREYVHTHNPLDDAKGNANALLKLWELE